MLVSNGFFEMQTWQGTI